MTERASTIPFVSSVFHPTDFSEASNRAFAHALAIALLRQTRLLIFHAGGEDEEWHRFPVVRQTLERWGLLLPDSSRTAVFRELGVRVTKLQAKGPPVRACFAEIERQQPDLVVLATEGRQGLARWLAPSVAEGVARRSRAMTLFVPSQGRGLIDLDTGHTRLRRILLPLDDEPDPSEAIVRATRVAEALGDPPTTITLLRVGSEPVKPYLPESEAYELRLLRGDGDVVESILAHAREADLVVMATRGGHGVLDAMRGSVTSQVVRRAPCPILAVPSV